jgi:radial spoke head protein 9
MDAQNLHLNIDFVGSSGIVLSPEQKASLQASLVILQSNHKFDHVYFWGKILGVKDDYYIAQGLSSDFFAEKRTLYR